MMVIYYYSELRKYGSTGDWPYTKERVEGGEVVGVGGGGVCAENWSTPIELPTISLSNRSYII